MRFVGGVNWRLAWVDCVVIIVLDLLIVDQRMLLKVFNCDISRWNHSTTIITRKFFLLSSSSTRYNLLYQIRLRHQYTWDLCDWVNLRIYSKADPITTVNVCLICHVFPYRIDHLQRLLGRQRLNDVLLLSFDGPFFQHRLLYAFPLLFRQLGHSFLVQLKF